MKEMWRSDSCYSNYGVDGSTCSFFIYLSEVSLYTKRLKGSGHLVDYYLNATDFHKLLSC